MPDISVLDIHLHNTSIATLTHVQGDRSVFAFNQGYVADADRPTLSLSFKDNLGGLITNIRPTQTVVPPFFSNLLPEGPLRRYLADRAGVNIRREFFLLWMLGRDLPGALSVHPTEGGALPPGVDDEPSADGLPKAFRFSLAGVQLKFSALKNEPKIGGLTIPTEGVGGSWILKLPSQQFTGVPENEFAMMTTARLIGMDVPDLNLVDLDSVSGLPDGIGELRGQALAVRRFDRTRDGPIHIEDFAQIVGAYPDDKYRAASYRNIAQVIGIEVGDTGVAEYIRRLVFNTLIGNGDMHLKNWSLMYPDGRNAVLSPAYDFVSTVPYLRREDTAALKYSRTRKMSAFSVDELKHLAARARLKEKLVIDTASETVRRFIDVWTSEKKHFALTNETIAIIDSHAASVPIYSELG